jgi:uncharacterized protein YjeT (DUF2065 family)
MAWSDLLAAIGVAAMVEGILYAAFPDATKRAMQEFLAMPTGARRRMALIVAGAGLLLLWIVRG